MAQYFALAGVHMLCLEVNAMHRRRKAKFYDAIRPYARETVNIAENAQ
jgi:hypothetical protein